MSTATTVRTVTDALAEVARWKADEETRHKAELVEVDQEISSLEQAVANLQQQLEALTKFREELVSKSDGLADGEIVKAYEAVFAALAEQSSAMEERSTRVAEAISARSEALASSLSESDVASLLKEYEQFKTAVEPTLAALPESYRSVIKEHHEQVVAKLRDHVSAIMSGPVTIDAEPLKIEVIYGVDAPDGAPELAIVVLPVDEGVHSEWLGRAEGLQTWIAARAVQGLYQAIKTSGPEGGQAMCGGHQGMLAIEVDLVGAHADVADALGTNLTQALSNAPEIAAAQVTIEVRMVDVDHLLPPEEDEGDDTDA